MTAANQFLERVSDLAAAGFLASFGGAAQALYQLYKGNKPFSFISFSICVLLSFFVGQVVGSFIPDSLSQFHDGLLLMSGFCVFPILDVISAYLPKFIQGQFTKTLPIPKDDQNDRQS